MSHRNLTFPMLAAFGLAFAAAEASAATVYDFSTVPQGTTVTPATINGATFSSPSDPGAFVFGPNTGLYSTLGANVLSSVGAAATLDISFATAQTGLTFDAAMGDFLALSGSDSITLTTNAGFSETLTPVIPATSGDLYPQVAFNLVNATSFTQVAISASDASGPGGLIAPESLTIADVTSTPVPLPATLWLLASGLGGLIFGRRRAASVAA